MTNKRPLSYLGINEKNPPDMTLANRAPTTADLNYELGDMWINKLTQISYQLVSKAAGNAIWGVITPGASDVDTINGLSPAAGNIIIDGGTNITDVNAGNTVTLNLDAAITLATSVTSPIYASAGAMAINPVGIFTLTGGAAVNVIAPAGSDIVFQMGDNAGADSVSFTDSDGVEVFAVDSNGGIGTLAGLTVTGAFTQTAGAVSIAQDNAADAVDIAGGNVARAITLGSTGAHTIDIGSAAAGAIAIDTAAGFSIDGATASNVTVTGAGLDLSLQGVGGAVNVTSTQAENDAILIEASAANGGVQIRAGTGGILIGDEADTTGLTFGNIAPTANRNITIGSGTVVTAAVTDDISIGDGGATTNANSIKHVDINNGGVTLGEVNTYIASGAVTSGTHLTEIATGNVAAGTATLNLSTGTGTKTVNVGNADAATTMNLDGDVVINTNVNGSLSACVGTSTGTVTLGNIANSGAVSIESAATIDLDAAGEVSINSTGSAINVGNDDIDQPVNIGTDGERLVTVGSINGAAATVIQAGTGGITFTGDITELNAEFVTRSGVDVTFESSPILQSTATTGAAPSGATGATNLMMFQEGFVLEEFIKGAGQTIIAPRASSDGLLISLDQVATEGVEINTGMRANSPLTYTIGTDAAFFAECTFKVADVSGCEPMYFGFRKVEADNADYTTYSDFVGYGLNNLVAGGDAIISTNLNGAGINTTDTNDAWADGASHTLQVLVSAAGVTTFTFDGGAPTATQAYTFDNGDVVQFWYTHIFGAGAPGDIHWVDFKCGFQA